MQPAKPSTCVTMAMVFSSTGIPPRYRGPRADGEMNDRCGVDVNVCSATVIVA